MRKASIVLGSILLIGALVVGCDKTKKRFYTNTVDSPEITQNSGDIDQIKKDLALLLEKVDSLAQCCEQNKNDLALLKQELTNTNVNINSSQSNMAALTSRVVLLENNVGGLKKVGNDLVLQGCNLVVRDAETGPQVPGVGNILVGRDNANRFTRFFNREPLRTGSNNIVVGGSNEYSGSGGLVVGALNKLQGDSATVLSCENQAKGEFSTVTGGTNGKANGKFSCVSGGLNRVVNGDFDWRAGLLFQNQ